MSLSPRHPWGVGGQWYTGAALFPFGFGLSYTTWEISAPKGPARVSLAATVRYLEGHPRHGGAFAPLASDAAALFEVEVANRGGVDSDYVLLAFLSPPGAGIGGKPLRTLVGFERVFVAAGASVTVAVPVPARRLTAGEPLSALEDAARGPRAAGEARAARRAVAGEYILTVGVEHPLQAWSRTSFEAVPAAPAPKRPSTPRVFGFD